MEQKLPFYIDETALFFCLNRRLPTCRLIGLFVDIKNSTSALKLLFLHEANKTICARLPIERFMETARNLRNSFVDILRLFQIDLKLVNIVNESLID